MSSDSARIGVDLAEKQLESAQKALNNVRAKSEVQINSAEMHVESADGQINSISAMLGNTTVFSPISGTVNQKFINIGEMAMAGAPLFTVVDIKSIKIEVALTEFDISKVSIGQDVKISLVACPDEKFVGKIYYISSVADPANKKFTVKIQLKNIDEKIKAGMMADIKIIIKEQTDVLVIPKTAIFIEDEVEKVYTVDNKGKIKIKTIKTKDNENEVIVIKGLVDGDIIVVEGNRELKDGDKIKIIK
ncbi:MAG: efflux RND transporter periplasmic adaptor subunit [Patescibacteria group bacterium]|nr:efflux RND transporter periplasmic adaptor subunit [Patescibacteria group bacterium]